MSPSLSQCITPRAWRVASLLLGATAARAQGLDSEAGVEPEREIPRAAPATAQRPTQVASPAASVTEVTVVGRRGGPLSTGEVITSTNVLTSERVQSQTASEPLHVLKLIPGVYMDDYNQGTISTGIGIRGFNTAGEMPAVKLLIDGIPSNFHHIGMSELKAIFPLEIDHIEVVKGTNDPRYGLNNIGGNVNVLTRQSEDVQIARVLSGSFRTIEPQLLCSFRAGRVRHTYFVGYRGSDGFRDNARMNRVAGSAKVFYVPKQGLKLGLIARAMSLDAQSPGYLTAKEAQEQPRLSPAYAREDAGEQHTLHLSGHLDYSTAGFSLQAKSYAQSFYRERATSASIQRCSRSRGAKTSCSTGRAPC
jgi:iron complex outermembrane receptor protein